MLDESEYERVARVHRECLESIKEVRREEGLPLEAVGVDARMKPVRDLYEEITGWKDMHHDAAMHHRLSLYGPICESCGKPLRSPRARLCAACGTRRPSG